MESIVGALISGVGAGITLILTIVLMFFAVRGMRNKFVPSTALVLESFAIEPSPAADEPFIRFSGRHKGLLSWLMTLIGIESRVDLTVRAKEMTLRESSLAGMRTVTMPLKHVENTICGYQRSLTALFFTIFFAVTFVWMALAAIPAAAVMLGTSSEARRESSAQNLAAALLWIFGSLLLFGISAVIYYFSKRISFAASAESVVGILFKRGLIGSQEIGLEHAEQANSLLRDLVTAACYGTPGVDIPAPPPLRPGRNPIPLIRWWMLPSGCALLLILAAVLYQYGSGATVTVITKPAGAAVLLDGQFMGVSDRVSGDMVMLRVTREAHTIGAQAFGYQNSSQSLHVGGLESEHRAEVSLSPLKYAVTFYTNPSGAHVQIDGRDFGATNENGRLVVADVERGNHSLSITHDGYRTASANMEIEGQREWRTVLVSDADAARQEAEDRQRGITEHLDRARMYFRQAQYKEAVSECDSVLQLDPGNSAALALKKQVEQTRSILGQ